ncbi:hypothetical protein J3R83DRAFT_11068 [Lanmaoa asiatica]|nr:hypothetical protein J3R83DRAFT_11068 [Lanmaoa asiatica]
MSPTYTQIIQISSKHRLELCLWARAGHVAVTCSLLHYDKGARNPLDEVTFSAKKESYECAKVTCSDTSLLRPSSFAEVWLRVHTKDGTCRGLIQAAYRHILKHLVSAGSQTVVASVGEAQAREEGFDLSVLGGPVAAATAEVCSRSRCGKDWGTDRRRRTVGRTPSFAENQLTAVPPNFRDESPSRKPRSKRGRDVSDSVESERPRKSLGKMSEKDHQRFRVRSALSSNPLDSHCTMKSIRLHRIIVFKLVNMINLSCKTDFGNEVLVGLRFKCGDMVLIHAGVSEPDDEIARFGVGDLCDRV